MPILNFIVIGQYITFLKFFRCSRFSEFDSNIKTAISENYKRRFDLQWTRPAFSRKYLQFSQIQYQSDGMAIERFLSRDQYLCKFMGTKESVHKKKSSTPTGLVWNTNMAAVLLFWNTNMAVR